MAFTVTGRRAKSHRKMVLEDLLESPGELGVFVTVKRPWDHDLHKKNKGICLGTTHPPPSPITLTQTVS